ncbi:MAG: TonB-dependent receptor [Bacteroides sp.]|nr:TonB-dependent receptor [Bacteroides sp.]
MRKLFLILMTLVACTLGLQAQTKTIHGAVVDAANGDPLIGATVMPIGGGQGVAADLDGNFTLTVPSSVKKVQVSYVGYESQTVDLVDGMVVKLKTAGENLDDVVVIGYGSAKKVGSVVGSMAVVGAAELENIPTPTFVDALQGQVPGLNIYSGSGDPSAVQSIQIRGTSSLGAGTTPLFVLDGAPVDASIFTTLNPNDIQNITVLKDASAVAIYGSRAANGVIVITSKRGAYGDAPKFTFRANYGWSQMVEDGIEMMNSKQYIEFRDKIGSPVSQDVYDAAMKYGIDTDWRKETFNSSAPVYSLDASLSGGIENLSYYLSVNHYDQEGIITQSGMRRETIRVNLDSRINDWFRVGVKTNLGYSKYQTNSQISNDGIYISNPMVFARWAMPYDSPRYYTVDENGELVYGEKAMYLHFSGATVPDFITETRKQERTKVTANVNLYEQISPIEGLIIRAQQAVDALDYQASGLSYPYESYQTPMGDWIGDADPYTGQYAGFINEGSNSQAFQRWTNFTYTHTAEYNHLFNDVHNMTLLFGEESIIERNKAFNVFAQGYTDRQLMLLSQATTVTPSNLGQSYSKSTFNSLLFKGTYDYDNRYFFETSFRRDGSSKFTPRHKYASFFSVGAMWNAKREKFLELVDWLNELQVRVSYGSTGNSSIGDYLFYGAVSPYGVGYGPNNSQSLGIASPTNYDLTWETVYSFDAGFRAKFIDKLTVDFDFYNKTTKNMLMGIPWSYTTGFGSGTGNIGSMVNRGVDVSVQADIIRTKDWYWGVRANFNYNHNEITELFNGRDKYVLSGYGFCYEVGHSAGEFYNVRYAGVDPRDGRQQWYDKNGNLTKVYNEDEDAVMTGKSYYAPWTGGFGTNARWKGFALSADFNWAADKYIMNNDLYFMQNANMGSSFNQSVNMLNVWTKPGDVTIYPNAGQEIQFDDRLLEDASFLRLKTLTLTYQLPEKVLNAMHLGNLVLHFTGRNLFTVTKFSGYDPEPLTNMYQFRYPNTRQYEFGLELTL